MPAVNDSRGSPLPADTLAETLKRTEIQRSTSSIPGRDIVQVLTEIPPGEEVGYVLAGTDTRNVAPNSSSMAGEVQI